MGEGRARSAFHGEIGPNFRNTNPHWCTSRPERSRNPGQGARRTRSAGNDRDCGAGEDRVTDIDSADGYLNNPEDVSERSCERRGYRRERVDDAGVELRFDERAMSLVYRATESLQRVAVGDKAGAGTSGEEGAAQAQLRRARRSIAPLLQFRPVSLTLSDTRSARLKRPFSAASTFAPRREPLNARRLPVTLNGGVSPPDPHPLVKRMTPRFAVFISRTPNEKM
jgi:hypothetical protein